MSFIKPIQSLLLLAFLNLFTNSAFAKDLKRQTFLNNNFSTKDQKVRVAFFDADSTLRVSRSGSVSANTPTDVMLLPNVEIQIAQLVSEGYLVVIVSNQSGIKYGHITPEIADSALFYTIELIKTKNPLATIQYFDFAEGDGDDRKPATGMAKRVENKLKTQGLTIDWKNSFMVGDSAYKKDRDLRPDGKLGTHFSNADRLFAENLNIKFYEPTDFFGWRAFGIDVFSKANEVDEFLKKYPSFRQCPLLFRKSGKYL